MFNTIKQRAKNSVKKKKGACVSFALIYMLIFPVLEFSVHNLSILFRRYSSFVLLAEYIALIVFFSALCLGSSIFFLEVSKRKDADFMIFFDGFDNIFRAIGLTVLSGLFTFLWSLLLIVPGIVASYSYRAAIYILAECPEISPLDALRISKNMMKGRRLRLFLLDLSFIGWFLLTGVTFGIAGLYVIPYFKAADTEFYRELKADYIENQNNPKAGQEDKDNNKSDFRSEEEKANFTWENK